MENLNYGMIVAIIALVISIYALITQKRHNVLSFRPIPYILPKQYSDLFSISLLNQGVGPLIVDKFTVIKNGKEYDALIDIAPDPYPGLKFSTYLTTINGRAIIPNKKLKLIEFQTNGTSEDDRYIKELEKSLHDVKMELIIKDIYGNKIDKYSKTLNLIDKSPNIQHGAKFKQGVFTV